MVRVDVASCGLLPPRPHFLQGYLSTGSTTFLQLELLNPTRLDGGLVVVVMVHSEHVWFGWASVSYVTSLLSAVHQRENQIMRSEIVLT